MNIPAGFVKLHLESSLYLETNGPFYCRHAGDEVALGMVIEHRHCNSAGTAHGGLLMTFADILLTIGPNVQLDLCRFLPTLNATCDFLGAANEGDWIEGRIEVLRTTKNFIFAQALVSTAAGAPVMRTSGTLLIRGERTARYSANRYFGRPLTEEPGRGEHAPREPKP
jgi:uncharacterized protein (TIGR00369 family)